MDCVIRMWVLGRWRTRYKIFVTAWSKELWIKVERGEGEKDGEGKGGRGKE